VPRRAPQATPARPRPAGTRAADRRFAAAGPATAWALGLALGALALGPGLRRGFLLSYDMVVVPREPFTAVMFGLTGGPPRAVPSDAVLAVAARVLPADVAQKLVLLLIFTLGCAGVAVLLDREPWLARLAGGGCYAWNPFVAERLVIGHWALLLGYAGLPWVLRAVLTWALPSWRGAGRLGLALLPAVAGGFAAMAISALVAVPAAALARRRWADVAVALGMLLAGSLPWLIPAVLRPVTADPAGIAAFAARADTPFGSLGSLVMLGGIWNAQVVPAAYGGAWSALWLAAVLLALAGYLLLGGVARWPGLGVAALAGLVIASIGITAPGRALLRAATELWPGFSVIRDGEQFVAPLALAEALGFGLAVAWAMRPRPLRASRPDVTYPAGLDLGVSPGLAGPEMALSAGPDTNLPAGPDRGVSPGVAGPDATPSAGPDTARPAGPDPARSPSGAGSEATVPAHPDRGVSAGVASPDVTPSAGPDTARPAGPDPARSPSGAGPEATVPAGLDRGVSPGGAGPAAILPAAARPDWLGWLIGVTAVCLPVLLLPGLAWGAAGRLRPVWYPAGMLSAARMINQSPAPGDALLLPWAAFRRPAWNHGEAVLDPWPRLLRRPVIWNDGSRVGGIQLVPDNPRARQLAGVIQSARPLTGPLAAAGVRFVIIDSGGLDRARLPGCRLLPGTLRTRPSGLAVCELPGPAGRG
jgi:hypothetical protein